MTQRRIRDVGAIPSNSHGQRHVAGRARTALWSFAFLSTLGIVITVALWPRDDVPQDPDAVVVLGGSGLERAQLGVELRDRFGATLVLSSSASVRGHWIGVTCDDDTICIIPVPETTQGEAQTVARLVDEHGWEHVTVATSRFHTTRSRLLFRQCLGDRVTVVGAPRPDSELPIGVGRHLREAVGTLAALTFQRAC